MNPSSTHTGPFYSLRDAAIYCAYKPDSFRKIINRYYIPRVGPKRSRFSKQTLDTFMNEPNTWLDQRKQIMSDNNALIQQDSIVIGRATRSRRGKAKAT